MSTQDGRLCLPEPTGETGDRCGGPEDCVTALCAQVTSTVHGRIFVRGYCAEPPLDGRCADRRVPVSGEQDTICMAMDRVDLEEERYVKALDELGSKALPLGALGRGRTISLVPPP